MKEFFQKRLRLHQKQMTRYLRYVFNDHFVLISTFLLGGVGLYYSNLLKTLPQPFSPGIVIILFLLLFSLTFGRFATLIKPADLVFLLPKEVQMTGYLNQAFRYSLLLPFGLLILVVGAAMPLAVVSTKLQFADFFVLLLTAWGLKFSQMTLQRLFLYQTTITLRRALVIGWIIASTLAIGTSLLFHPLAGLLIAGLQLVFFHYVYKKNAVNLDWEKMVQKEQNRLHRIYRFINLFTDVPQITATVKRRKYLDVFLQKISFRKENTYLYLYARRMLRGSEFSGLYLRLTVIGGFVLAFVQERWFSLAIGWLFLYLIGFQLVPIYSEFQYMILTHLYPISPAQKVQAVQRVLLILLFVAAIVFGVISLFSMKTVGDKLLLFAAYLGFVPVFMYAYVPKRLKKLEN